MKLTFFISAALASVASARTFTLFEHIDFQGFTHTESRPDDGTCWNLNGNGDHASSVTVPRGDVMFSCTIFYRDDNCSGSQWIQTASASTVPGFLNDHIRSFRNQLNC